MLTAGTRLTRGNSVKGGPVNRGKRHMIRIAEKEKYSVNIQRTYQIDRLWKTPGLSALSPMSSYTRQVPLQHKTLVPLDTKKLGGGFWGRVFRSNEESLATFEVVQTGSGIETVRGRHKVAYR